jgi:hypothetical protein
MVSIKVLPCFPKSIGGEKWHALPKFLRREDASGLLHEKPRQIMSGVC